MLQQTSPLFSHLPSLTELALMVVLMMVLMVVMVVLMAAVGRAAARFGGPTINRPFEAQ